jgi:hypothetical protein
MQKAAWAAASDDMRGNRSNGYFRSEVCLRAERHSSHSANITTDKALGGAADRSRNCASVIDQAFEAFSMPKKCEMAPRRRQHAVAVKSRLAVCKLV